MQKVNLLKTNNDGSQSLLVSCLFDGHKILLKGDEALIKTLYSEGIPCYASGKNIFPQDGPLFLNELRHVFRSGYLTATDVIDE
jgi:hypothetical protein